MPSYHPRSIVSLILVGFAVVLAPFVAAVVTAIVQVDRFAQQSRTAVVSVGSAVDDSRLIVEQLTEMQRALGQFAVLGDRDFLAIYASRREEFRDALDRLRALGVEGIDASRLDAIAADEEALARAIDSSDGNPAGGELEDARRVLTGLASRARDVLAESGQLVQRQVNDVTERAEGLQGLLLVFSAAAVPVTIVLVVLFTVLITQPMRALGAAIRGLGSRSVDEPIAIKGPRDIEALAGELEWLRRRIETLEAERSTFLQHISHELKTPLTTIREGSELLTESLGEDNAEEAEIAWLLLQNGMHLQSLIEDLLRFARTQELASDLEFQAAVDLSAVINDSIATLTVVSEAKGIVVKRQVTSISARCDAGKIRVVVDNLMTNAIKYSPEQSEIRIALFSDGVHAVIDVEDSGPGVGHEDRDRIFEPFQRGSAEYQSSVKGTGLGLSIAKEYVEAHGGTIELVDCDSGAHFRVTLPLAGPAIEASTT
jgi:two-component system sensor histidine kinase GlrK